MFELFTSASKLVQSVVNLRQDFIPPSVQVLQVSVESLCRLFGGSLSKQILSCMVDVLETTCTVLQLAAHLLLNQPSLGNQKMSCSITITKYLITLPENADERLSQFCPVLKSKMPQKLTHCSRTQTLHCQTFTVLFNELLSWCSHGCATDPPQTPNTSSINEQYPLKAANNQQPTEFVHQTGEVNKSSNLLEISFYLQRSGYYRTKLSTKLGSILFEKQRSIYWSCNVGHLFV